jgi:hypothetical protein
LLLKTLLLANNLLAKSNVSFKDKRIHKLIRSDRKKLKQQARKYPEINLEKKIIDIKINLLFLKRPFDISKCSKTRLL